MDKSIKAQVKYYLTERGLIHIFNEKDYRSHYNKAVKGKGGNRFLAGLAILDLFIQDQRMK